MKLVLLVIAMLSLPIAYGLSCSNAAQKDVNTCNYIINSNLSSKEKQELIANIIYQNHNYANHSFVYDWNNNIQFNSAPEGVETKSNGNIKNVWLKIIAIMPSVLSGEKLLTPGIGKVLTKYNYEVEVPSGKEGGDCKTEFKLNSERANLNVYLNDNLIGTSSLIDFQGSNKLNFKSVVTVETSIEAKHYKTFRWCCGKGRRGGCLRFCEECRHDGTDTRNSELTLEDSKQAYQYWPIVKSNIKAIDNYRNTTVGILNISNFDAFELSFTTASLKQFNYHYDINVSLSPYDVLTLRANKLTRREPNNLNFEQSNNSYKFYVARTQNCKLKYYSHFNSWEQNCNLNFNFVPFVIKTDKTQYNEDEVINVDLEPKNTEIKVKYDNEEFLVKDNIQFKAKKNINKIEAYFKDRQTDKIIHVKNNETWDFALSLSILTSVIYSYYLLARKYWGFSL